MRPYFLSFEHFVYIVDFHHNIYFMVGFLSLCCNSYHSSQYIFIESPLRKDNKMYVCIHVRMYMGMVELKNDLKEFVHFRS